jgi:hypothetical protein
VQLARTKLMPPEERALLVVARQLDAAVVAGAGDAD